MDEKIKKLQELFANGDLAESVFSGDAAQALANLAKQGIELTREELMEFSAGILNGAKAPEDGELSEEELVNVAGGAKKKKANIGFFNGLFDAADDKIFGTAKGAKKSGPLYAIGYSIGYGLNKLF